MRAAGVRFAAVALNPPFGLSWRDAAHAKGKMNSTALDAMQTREELYDLLRYEGYERKLDQMFARRDP